MLLKVVPFAALVASVFGQQQTQNLTAALASNNDTSALTNLLSGFPELVSGLASAQNITILAPSNAAISALLNSTTGQALAADPGSIQAVLQYHVLNGTFRAADVKDTPTFIPTMLTNSTFTNVTGGQVVNAVKIGDNVAFFSGLNANSTVTQADVNFTAGVIHVIDQVLTLPANDSTTAVAANLTSLAGALTAADLVDTVDSLQDVTIFAPSNEAFQAIGSALAGASTEALVSVLGYHVVNGTVGYSTSLSNDLSLQTLGGGNVTVRIEDGNVFVNGAKVVLPDVLVSNGVVHVIDEVLNPNNTSAAPSSSATAGSPAFSGASTVSDVPFTSAVPTPSSTIGGGASASASAASSSSSSSSSSESSGGAMPMRTGAVGAAALFGAGAVMANL